MSGRRNIPPGKTTKKSPRNSPRRKVVRMREKTTKKPLRNSPRRKVASMSVKWISKCHLNKLAIEALCVKFILVKFCFNVKH